MRFFGHGQHKDSDGSKHSLQLPIAGPLSFGAESGVRVLKRGFSESGLAQPNHKLSDLTGRCHFKSGFRAGPAKFPVCLQGMLSELRFSRAGSRRAVTVLTSLNRKGEG